MSQSGANGGKSCPTPLGCTTAPSRSWMHYLHGFPAMCVVHWGTPPTRGSHPTPRDPPPTPRNPPPTPRDPPLHRGIPPHFSVFIFYFLRCSLGKAFRAGIRGSKEKEECVHFVWATFVFFLYVFFFCCYLTPS